MNTVYRRLSLKWKCACGGAWFFIMYSLLLAFSARVLMYSDEFEQSGRTLIIYLVVAITIVAASLLTKMLIGWFSELREFRGPEDVGS